MIKNFKKGQITIFIILGLIIVFFFFLMLYQSNSDNKDLMDITESQLSNILDSSSTKNFIELCIEDTAKKGIYILGKQGGYIYDYQGGLVSPGYDYLAKRNLYEIITNYDFADIDPKKEYIKYNVSYGLYYNESKNRSYLSPPPPMYPANPKTGKIVNSDDIRKLLWPGYTIRKEIMPKPGYGWKEAKYYLGDVNGFFPKLCLQEGENYKVGKEENFSKSGYGCGDGSYGEIGENTIQEQLQEYINNNLKKCTKFRNFSQVLPNMTGINITEGNILSNILFGTEDIHIDVSYPIEVSMSKRNSRLVLKEFEVSIPIRFKKIWSHLNEILYKDSTKFSYEKTDSSTIYGSRYWEKGFEYSLTPLGFDTIYTLTDAKSLIDENSFSFNVLIHNRRPALEYIHQDFILRDDLNCFDIISWPEEKITITPQGYDPDENKMTYDYTGWNQDYSSTYNNICYKIQGPIDCTKDLKKYLDCEYKEYPAPNYWTKKTGLYGVDNKTGEYDVKETDIGVHILNVSVGDGEMKDWQELKILIFDTPQIILSAKNQYDDISNDYTSPEDYTILSSTLTSSILTLQDFLYEASKIDSHGDLISPSVWDFSTDEEATIMIPRKSANDNSIFPPEDITQEMKYEFDELSDYFINLTASNGIMVGSSNLTLTVKECLPHRSSVKSYPYSIAGFDPYLADHTCCLGNINEPDTWSIANTGVTCFSKTEYGSYKAFTKSELQELYDLPATDIDDYNNIDIDEGTLPINNLGILDLGNDFKNDIFVREYIRNCDGTRGNICNGSLSDTISIYKSCDDIYSQNGRRCSGPSPDIMDDVTSNVNPSLTSCIDYPGTTFEAVHDDNPNLRACNDVFKCSSKTNQGYASGGNYLCRATCDGNGGCNNVYECKSSCEVGETGSKCQEIGSTGKYEERGSGTCGTKNGVDQCLSADFVPCQNGYACNGDSCATSCNSNNECASGYFCNTTMSSPYECQQIS